MFAIVRTGGKQFRITENTRIRVPKLDTPIGQDVVFDEVLMVSSEGKTHVGRPKVKGASVIAQVLEHGREDKIVVFTMKRRKNERRKAGHREDYTDVLIRKIQFEAGQGSESGGAPSLS
jgi:large subunit ribosomal protein L21